MADEGKKMPAAGEGPPNRLLQEGVERLKSLLGEMRDAAIDIVGLSLRAIGERSPSIADRVETADSVLDQFEVQIDDDVVHFMARERPVAQDLRFAVAVSKAIRQLERVGDHAVTVARLGRKLENAPAVPIPREIAAMGAAVMDMTARAVESLLRGDTGVVAGIEDARREVAAKFRRVRDSIVSRLSEGGQGVVPNIEVLLAAQSLDRAASRARVIAEITFFSARGVDVRGHQLPPHTPPAAA